MNHHTDMPDQDPDTNQDSANQDSANQANAAQELDQLTHDYDDTTIGERADLGDGTPLPGCAPEDPIDPATGQPVPSADNLPRAAADLARTQAELDDQQANPVKGDRSAPEERRMQGHWLLAKMGKRVLRPGGIELTTKLLQALQPTTQDRIVEFGPGVGRTTQELLGHDPEAYWAIDPHIEYMSPVQVMIDEYNAKAGTHANAQYVQASAHQTGLPDGVATKVIGEAMLTMHSNEDKLAIMREAYRLLAPGGSYAIHELAFTPDDTPQEVVEQVLKALSRTIRIGARPLPIGQWRDLLSEVGFRVQVTHEAPMHLLEPRRIIADEGFGGALTFFNNVRTNPEARKRIGAMRRVFKANEQHLCAVAMVLTKP